MSFKYAIFKPRESARNFLISVMLMTVKMLFFAVLLIAIGGAGIIGGFAKAWVFTPGTGAFAWVTTSLVTGIPGICIQLVVMPAVVLALTRAKLIPNRYPKGETA